jgi:hypothetical protein
VNGTDSGFTTPHTFTNLNVGSYSVYVTRAGYVTPATQTKSVTKNAVTTFDFTLSQTPTASITVVSPNGGESWVRGNAYPIKWKYSGELGPSVSIVLYDGNDPVFIITPGTSKGSGGSGSYTWNIPADKPLSTDYRVSIQSTSQAAVKDMSDKCFSIVADTTPTGSITVVSPNGGESWLRGNAYPITWTYTGNPGSMVSIVLYMGENLVYTVTPSTSIGSGGAGSYTWNIPSDKPLGNDYRVSIQSTSQPAIKDLSDDYFSVVAGKIGVIRDSNLWLLDASANGAYGAGDLAYSFGKAGDVYVTGDWNKDNKNEIGVIRDNNTWLLDASGNGRYGAGDLAYNFGKAGDVFVTGDWNNDGRTEIGVIRNNNLWLLDASGDGRYGAGDLAYSFGKAGDKFVTGDWNKDGKTEIGVVRNISLWLLDASGDGAYGAGDLAYTFGKAGDVYLTGDWNNDGKTEIGVLRNNNSWLLDSSGDGVYGAGDLTYTFGKAGDVPVSGKWS